MLTTKHEQRGVTLLEIMLVLAIGAMILVLGLRQYYAFKFDTDVERIRYQVDLIFQAMTQYYQAHCSMSAPINSLNNPSFAFSIPITIQTLQDEGYLKEPLTRIPLIDYSDGSAPQGIIAQFNIINEGVGLPKRTVALSPSSGSGAAEVGTIILWNIQVAVNIKPAAGPEAIQKMLGANCLSYISGGFRAPRVLSCNEVPTGSVTTYAVFGRLPSESYIKSNLWQTIPRIKQFTQMYTTDPISILIDPTQGIQTSNQFYVCGG